MRRPAHLERAGALTPRDRIWAAIRSFGRSDPFSVAEIMVISGQRADTVLSYLQGLTMAGYTCEPLPSRKRPVTGPARRECRRFYLARDVGVEAPRVTQDGRFVTQGAGRDQLWRSMRVLREFDCRELAQAASTEAHPVSVDEASTYAKLLARAGYLVPGKGPKKSVRYRFVASKNTGPRPPLVQRDKSVMDGNTGEIVWRPTHEQ